MRFLTTRIAGLMIAESDVFADARGSFQRLYCQPSQAAQGLPAKPVVQINRSITAQKGTVRGMHFQHPPAMEQKTVRCLHGRILDVAVDLRAQSPTFLQHEAIELDAKSGRALVIPEGFAHGFQTLEDDCELLYLHTAAYSKPHEAGLRHDDPALGIRWPLAVTVLSERDQSYPLIDAAFKGVAL